jgi:hypothetical protein
MIKSILCLIVVLFLSACDSAPGARALTMPPVPEELEGCKAFKLKVSEDGITQSMYVLRCKKQTTTTTQESCGKNCTKNISTTVAEE